MEIYRDRARNKLFLSQNSYILKVLERLVMNTAKSIDTPAANARISVVLSPQSGEEKEYMSKVPYSTVVSSLMYAMVRTRPDIAHVVSVVGS